MKIILEGLRNYFDCRRSGRALPTTPMHDTYSVHFYLYLVTFLLVLEVLRKFKVFNHILRFLKWNVCDPFLINVLEHIIIQVVCGEIQANKQKS